MPCGAGVPRTTETSPVQVHNESTPDPAQNAPCGITSLPAGVHNAHQTVPFSELDSDCTLPSAKQAFIVPGCGVDASVGLQGPG